MACPTCILAGVFGGWIGGYIGVNPPKNSTGRIFSGLVTLNFVSITLIALDAFKISLCANRQKIIGKTAQVVACTFLIGTIYSIAVNYLLGRYVLLEQQEEVKPPLNKEKNLFDQQPVFKGWIGRYIGVNPPKPDPAEEPLCHHCCKDQKE